MRFSTSWLVLAAPLLSSATPVKRASATDILVLRFANVLEQLETQFYTEVLAKFSPSDFQAAGFSSGQVPVQQLQVIRADEATHTTVLASTLKSLGSSPISGCHFNFGSVLTDVATVAATARVVENLGVSAYLGAAHLVSDPSLLTAAASILTVEARHETVLNILNGATAIPQAFDIPFTPSQVLAVASPFISGCDTGIPANPTLTVTNKGKIVPGTALTFTSKTIRGDTNRFFCQMIVGGATSAIVLPFHKCVVPKGINGPVAVFITSNGTPLANNVVTQVADTTVAGPTIVFVDSVPDKLSKLVRPH